MSQAQAAVSTATQSANIFGRPLSIFGIPVDGKTIFSDYKGNYKSRIEKRQRKLIVKTTFIKFFLRQDEQIRCLTTGYSSITALEQLFTGLAFLFFKRSIFAFTDKRILHIPTRFDRSTLGSISQILYDDCAHIGLKGRTLVVKYKDGREEQFHYIGRKEIKKLKVLLSAIDLKPKSAGKLNARVYLCPSCTNPLDADRSTCPTCKLEFKSGFQAKLRSLLLPGGGYFYTGHPVLGTLLGLMEVAMAARLILDGLALNQGFSVNLGWVAVLIFALLGMKSVSAYHTEQLTENFIPLPKDFAVRKI